MTREPRADEEGPCENCGTDAGGIHSPRRIAGRMRFVCTTKCALELEQKHTSVTEAFEDLREQTRRMTDEFQPLRDALKKDEAGLYVGGFNPIGSYGPLILELLEEHDERSR